MKKALKITGKILLGLMILLLAFLLIVFVYHRIKLKSEEPLTADHPGQMVEVDGHKMHVFTKGAGEHTIVFLSGSGTAAPIYDFKSLYELLADDCRIAVIEKFGYGYSDIIDGERSFGTMLRQDREALAKAEITGKYILCPHSMSGLEAMMWAQNHPDEVEAIVGLDMFLPKHYDGFDLAGSVKTERLAAAAREMGIIRFFYTDSTLPSALSDEDKRIYKAIAAKKAVNIDVISETLAIPDACGEINGKPLPETPILMFVSNGEGTGVEPLKLKEINREYTAEFADCKLVELDCGHYVHNFEYERISTDMKEFIKALG